jgi:starch-binding outer membrane protein, SusD/RagB family
MRFKHNLTAAPVHDYILRRPTWVSCCIYFFIAFIQADCKKLVEVNPPTSGITGATAYNTDATAIAVMTGVYISMSQSFFSSGGITSMSLFPSLSADELSVYGDFNPVDVAYYTNSLTNTITGSSDFWNNIYPTIYIVNSAIEGLTSSSGLTPAVKQQLMGEAYFMRAFCYFYLVNLYGDVPLVTGTNYTVNAVLARTPAANVWTQITGDLKSAQNLLDSNYVDATLLNMTPERVRPTLWAATALLSRAYLYQQKWDSAVIEATAVINQNTLYSLDTLNGVFLANSNEAIWQLQPVNAGQNTQDALLFVLPPTGPDGISFPVYMDTVLVDAFEPGDQRRANWVDSANVGNVTYYYPYKYKANTSNATTVTEYEMVLRLGEQYLIRAEAEAWLNELGQATADLDTIRSRAGLGATSANTQTDMLTAIYHERQVEFFTEWGHRWLDLKRTNLVNTVMSTVTPEKGGQWNPDWQWYPISLYELQHDHNLVQNNGYGN